MFANGFERIYSYHLKKCGGTSLNRWLSRHVDDYRNWDDERYFNTSRDHGDFLPGRAAAASASFVVSKLVYTHVPLRSLVLPNTFCLVVLRDPIARILSQVADWRRGAGAVEATVPEFVRTAMQDAGKLSLRAFLERYAFGALSDLFDNYQTRALSRHAPVREEGRAAALDLLPMALKALRNDYHLVGVLEQAELVRLAIASVLGLPFDLGEGERLNVTGASDLLREEAAEAADILAALTTSDGILYAEAVNLFVQRHLDDAIHYSGEVFERKYASRAMARVRPHVTRTGATFSLREPLLASGIHGRDAAGTPDCTVWTGPQTKSVLYVPAPIGTELTVKVWLRGLAYPEILDGLSVDVDDAPAAFRVAHEDGWERVLSIPAISQREYVKVGMEVEETAASVLDPAHIDPRKRGVAIGLYGWDLPYAWLAD